MLDLYLVTSYFGMILVHFSPRQVGAQPSAAKEVLVCCIV